MGSCRLRARIPRFRRGSKCDRVTDSPYCSPWIEDIEPRKVLFIVRYNHALVCFGDGSDNHIQVASGFPGSATFRHETSPDQGRLLVERQNPPFDSDCGPSDPANHASNRSRFLPFGLSSMPRRISATVREETNKSPSDCTLIHSNSDSDGSGFVILLMTFLSRR